MGRENRKFSFSCPYPATRNAKPNPSMELSRCDFVVSISGSLKIKERTIGGTHQLCQNFWPFSLADRFRALAVRQME